MASYALFVNAVSVIVILQQRFGNDVTIFHDGNNNIGVRTITFQRTIIRFLLKKVMH